MNAEFPASPRRGEKARLRNTARLIETAALHFDAAQYQGILAIHAHLSWGRTIRLNYDGPTVTDLVRCSSADLFSSLSPVRAGENSTPVFAGQ